MEITEVTQLIREKIDKLRQMRGLIKERAEAKARASSNYDRAITINLIKLKNGQKFELDGQIIESPPASIMDKLSRGLCWQEKLDMELTEGEYKSLITNIETVKAELNGLQSINRYLDEG